MEQITATQDTFKKKSPEQSSTLSAGEKQFCRKGETFQVNYYSPEPGGHWRVEIGGGTWFIFDAAAHGPASHWQCSWEQDDAREQDNAEITPELTTRAVQAQAAKTPPVGLGLDPAASFDTLITPHFTYGEVTQYKEERRFLSAGSIPTIGIGRGRVRWPY